MAAIVHTHLATPVKIGALHLKNRVVMASLTRNRTVHTVPDALNVEYYRQRASAGLILSEGVLISPQGTEWTDTPGLYSNAHVVGWKAVTDAVHAAGGLIVAQLWHVGRMQHPLHQNGAAAVSASDVQAAGGKFRLLVGEPGYVKPVAIADPATVVEDYRLAAVNAKAAGFDGVEFHSANGYLGHQFLDSRSNIRVDRYGGDEKQRCTFGLEVIDALISVYGADRVGIKISPGGGFNDVGDAMDVTLRQYTYYLQQLSQRKIAYAQIMNHLAAFDSTGRGTPGIDIAALGTVFSAGGGAVILNGGYTGATGDALIADNKASAVAYGYVYIANADLAARLIHNQELSNADYTTLYNYQGYPHSTDNRHKGYTDYTNFSATAQVTPAEAVAEGVAKIEL